MDRRRPRGQDDSNIPAEVAAREAADLLTRAGRRYPVATVAVLLIALVVGLLWYWQQQRRLNEQQEQQVRQTQAQAPPAPSPRPAPPPEPPATQASASIPAETSYGPSEGAVNLLLGNPSGATSDPSNRDNYLMLKRYYALS